MKYLFIITAIIILECTPTLTVPKDDLSLPACFEIIRIEPEKQNPNFCIIHYRDTCSPSR